MSKISLTPNASGTGNFTIASPATNTDRTLTLPDATGTINTSGAVNEVPAGTASAPSIYPTGDTNTGIFFPAADTIAFAEGGTEAMRIDSSGQITYTAQPAFQVENIATSLAVGNVVPWSVVTANRGSHYSSVNHRFTAPVAGYYQFNLIAFTVKTTNTGDAYWDLRVNATTRFRVYQAKSGNANTHAQVMGSVTLSLSANDYVDVYYQASPGNVNMEASSTHNIFSGFLLG